MNKKFIIIAVIAALAIGGIIWYMRRQSTKKPKVDAATGSACMDVPKTFRKWTGDFSAMDTDYDQMRVDHLGQAYEDGGGSARVAGFFKALGIEPRGQYIRHYKDTLKAWLSSADARPHWEVEEGELKCAA